MGTYALYAHHVGVVWHEGTVQQHLPYIINVYDVLQCPEKRFYDTRGMFCFHDISIRPVIIQSMVSS